MCLMLTDVAGSFAIWHAFKAVINRREKQPAGYARPVRKMQFSVVGSGNT
jgi:hypothetical protein